MPVFLISGFDLSMLCKTPSNTVLMFTHIDGLFMMYFIRFKNALSTKGFKRSPLCKGLCRTCSPLYFSVNLSYILSGLEDIWLVPLELVSFSFFKEMEMTTMQAWYKIHL